MNQSTNHPQPRPHPRTDSGFTLVELLIVMSVILVLMTLAIPKLMQVNIKANETSATASLRTLNEDEGSYASDFPVHGYACTLPALGGKSGSAPTPDAAQLIADDLASGHKSGYTFTITCGDKTSNGGVDQFNSYAITAVPNAVGRTGNRGFCTDQTGEIRYDPKGSTNCTELLQ
jgi:type IV pilus assembly protein PilA